jgi:EAL domain-containing protein (putative c-di-GMP-specific phosphodiesterase class I)
MRKFKALGVQLAEDDLGAGYSSPTRLRQFPFD